MAPCSVFAFVEREKMLYMLSFSLINIVLCGVSKFVRQENVLEYFQRESELSRRGAVIEGASNKSIYRWRTCCSQWLSSNQANKRVMIGHMSAMITAERGWGQGCTRISRNRRALDMPRAHISVPADWGERRRKNMMQIRDPGIHIRTHKKLIWMMKIYWFFHGVLASVSFDGRPRNIGGCEHVRYGGRYTHTFYGSLPQNTKTLHKL